MIFVILFAMLFKPFIKLNFEGFNKFILTRLLIESRNKLKKIEILTHKTYYFIYIEI